VECQGREERFKNRIPRQEKYVGDPDVVLTKTELSDNEGQRGSHHGVFQGAEQPDDAEGSDDNPESKAFVKFRGGFSVLGNFFSALGTLRTGGADGLIVAFCLAFHGGRSLIVRAQVE